MRLFLIRHGETVDNVAGVYAGSRDSQLTNHGFQQATRLGQHFKTLGLTFSHLFASHLQRAATTASMMQHFQAAPSRDGHPAQAVPEVVRLRLLMEQDFGSMEGKKFYERALEAKMTGKQHRGLENKDTSMFVHVESKEVMARRADTFLDHYLLPLLDDESRPAEKCVAIVSHGIFLSTLWKRLLLRLPPKSVELCPKLETTVRPSLNHLGGWSNTGYLELSLMRTEVAEPVPTSVERAPPPLLPSLVLAGTSAVDKRLGKVRTPYITDGDAVAQKHVAAAPAPIFEGALQISTSPIAHGWTMTVLAINSKVHLKGLKRTGGGIGSSRHDASQKSIEAFFKRRKAD